MNAAVCPEKLTRVALDILTTDLESEGYGGNVLSIAHKAALAMMLRSFADYTTGALQGRNAFPLPTGMGKTAAVVAFITALERCGYTVPVSVAASQVQALCKLHQALIAHGVPQRRIGLKHSLTDAPVTSTGDTEHLYQLVTHARVRGGTDFVLFGEYMGKPRALCLYDETLWRADTLSLRTEDAQGAIAWLLVRSLPDGLESHLRACDAAITGAIAGSKVHANGAPLELPWADEADLAMWAQWLSSGVTADKGVTDDLLQLLKLSGDSLQVLSTPQGPGVIAIRQAVPEALRNVAILDASAPIRELARLDTSVAVVASFDPVALKSFEHVAVSQYLSGGGRSTLAIQAKAALREATALSREVADIIWRDLAQDPDTCFLIFTYRERGRDNPQGRIRADLRASGVDLTAQTTKGKARFEFLTWGQHEGLNGFEHSGSVILAGVLQRDHLSLSAAIKGQQNDTQAATPGPLIRALVESEVAHCVYQAASRGSCRRVIDGKAKAMRLHVIHKHQGLKATLDHVMPGAVWSYPVPQFLPMAKTTGKGEAMLTQLQDYLKTIPGETLKVSSRALKVALGCRQNKATQNQFTSAVNLINAPSHGWSLAGRSLVRAT